MFGERKGKGISGVKSAQDIQLKVRAEKKEKKVQQSLKLLEVLKNDGGPLTANDIQRLDDMDTRNLLNQIAYLRCTIAPNIRQKSKRNGKFEVFSDEELRQQIIDVIKPIEEVEVDLESLVIDALNEETSKTSVVTLDKRIGEIGIWKGSFNRQCIGTLVTDEKLQLFRKVKQSYYRVCDLTENPDEW